VVTALIAVAVVLLFVLIRAPGPSAPATQSTPTTGSIGPRLTTPPRTGTVPRVPATTTGGAPGGAPGGSAAAAACTAADVHIVTTSDKSYYLPGSSVTVTTLLRALRRCEWAPVAVRPYGCAVTVSVVDALGDQDWPAPGQGETCSSPAPTVLRPAVTESVRAMWDGRVVVNGNANPAPPGTYRAVGVWAWSSGPGLPLTEITVRSVPFTVG